MNQHITLATEKDYLRLRDFAEKVGVEWSEAEQETQFYMLEKEDLAASIGVKMIEDVAILRAMIIDPDQCGLGETMYLLTYVCEQAKELGAQAVYLVTSVPSYIFQLTGFTEVNHSEIPEGLFSHSPFDRLTELKSVTIMMRFLTQ